MEKYVGSSCESRGQAGDVGATGQDDRQQPATGVGGPIQGAVIVLEEPADAERFWAHAEEFLDRPGVSRSTMMGLPCLRIDGQFFASFDRRTGDLLVKLEAGRVDALVEAGEAQGFAPAGRRFREWAAIPPAREASWDELLTQAFDFVASG